MVTNQICTFDKYAHTSLLKNALDILQNCNSDKSKMLLPNFVFIEYVKMPLVNNTQKKFSIKYFIFIEYLKMPLVNNTQNKFSTFLNLVVTFWISLPLALQHACQTKNKNHKSYWFVATNVNFALKIHLPNKKQGF